MTESVTSANRRVLGCLDDVILLASQSEERPKKTAQTSLRLACTFFQSSSWLLRAPVDDERSKIIESFETLNTVVANSLRFAQ